MTALQNKILKILLVEDDEIDSMAIRRCLKKAAFPHQLLVFSSGDSALQHLQKLEPGELPGIILLDLKLPGISGLDVLRHIKANPDLLHLPVFILTTSDHDTDQSEAWRLGASGYFVKGHLRQDLSDLNKFLYDWYRINDTPGSQT